MFQATQKLMMLTALKAQSQKYNTQEKFVRCKNK
jgi:hypothetical protein